MLGRFSVSGWRPLALCTVGSMMLGATLFSTEARAFCGFFVSGADAQLYNNASQVALLRKGNHTVMTLSNTFGIVGAFVPLLLGAVAERIGLGPTMWFLMAGPMALLLGLHLGERRSE